MAELNESPAKNAGGAKPRKKMSTRVDLTAMVDLAFLLVTFFMLTTSLSKPKAMNLAMPDNTEPGPVAASRTVTLCLGKDNQLVYYRGEIDKPVDAPQVIGYQKDLRHTLLTTAQKIKAETGKDMIVVIKPGEHSVYGNVVNTIDELNITRSPIYAVTEITPKDNDLLKQKSIF
ncbi:biopolymer transporter ExbD [Mucilaginibacter mali]|uniref:Biopolymer transporter ExbD n=1 Tax=Mucilaginibacter mali TaxID=2740462 RepID=A0A7D4PZQ4_9SPHI|nr:biopolymer transporter ExbD [Mucilaginibacter mali]QKJ29106.1 biopolymer transporter ExbD [Mucilaginibacter mali]